MQVIGNPNELPSGAQAPSGQFTRARSCAVIPHRTTDPEGFIETRNTCPTCDRPILISFTALREMARVSEILVDAKTVEDLTADFAATEQEQWDLIAELSAEVAYLQEVEAARDLVASEDTVPEEVAA